MHSKLDLVIHLDLVKSAMTRPLLYWNWNHFLSEEKDSVSTLQGKPLDQDIRICSTPSALTQIPEIDLQSMKLPQTPEGVSTRHLITRPGYLTRTSELVIQ